MLRSRRICGLERKGLRLDLGFKDYSGHLEFRGLGVRAPLLRRRCIPSDQTRVTIVVQHHDAAHWLLPKIALSTPNPKL